VFGEIVMSVRVTNSGAVSVFGTTPSNDFPTTAGSARPTSIGPNDYFVSLLEADGSGLIYSTYFGGTEGDLAEHRHQLLPDGSVMFAGLTRSDDIAGAQGSYKGNLDGMVGRLSADGSQYTLARYVGGSGEEHLLGPVVDSSGRIYVFGSTGSQDFPVTSNAVQSQVAGGVSDAFLVVLDPTGAIEYATYIGGSGDELVRGIAVSPEGDVFLTGVTTSGNFPVTEGAFQTSGRGNRDGYVIKLTRN
jgi:hypothetical protein